MIHNFTIPGVMVLSAYLGWIHANEPLFEAQWDEVLRSTKRRGLCLFLAGAGVMLWVLLDPNGSTARETYTSMSTTGMKVFWLFMMGSLVIVNGAAQIAFHDAMAALHRFIWKHGA